MHRKLVVAAVLCVSVLGSSTALAVAANMRESAIARGTRADAQSLRITLDQGTLSATQAGWNVASAAPPPATRVWRNVPPASVEPAAILDEPAPPRDIAEMRCVWRTLTGGTEGTGVQVCE